MQGIRGGVSALDELSRGELRLLELGFTIIVHSDGTHAIEWPEEKPLG